MKPTRKNSSSIVWTGNALNAMLFAWIVSIAIQIFYNVQFLNLLTPQGGVISFLFSVIPIGVGLWLARQGRPKSGVILIVILGVIGVTNTLITRGGLISPVSYGYMTHILLIGFVVGKRAGFVTALLVGVLYTLLFWGQINNVIASEWIVPLGQLYLFSLSRLVIVATFTYFAAQAIEDAFDTVRGRTAELEETNGRLQQTQHDLAQANTELQASESRYRTIVTSLGDAYFIARPPNARLIDVNETGCEMLGYTREEMLAMTGVDMNANWSQADFVSFYEELHNGGNNTLRKGHYIHKAGHIVPVEIRASLIELEGEPAVFAIVRDMSEREEALAKIEGSLAEKEVLLREVHHRVKNNLQIVSSLMRTSSRKFPDDPLVQSELNDLGSRVMSMAAIHQQLYQSGDFAQIEFAKYAQKLVEEIGRTHIPPAKEIVLEFDLQPINLSLETAVPAGLIINELVLNAIKHGYPPEKERGIMIRCELSVDESNDVVVLTIENDGLPFDVNEAVNRINGHRMGMQLVDLLVRQIEGELMATIENGMSRFTLLFRPREERVPR